MSQHYWTTRYLEGRTGWDMGQVSPPLRAYIDQLSRKDFRILIPGAGNSYEAEYLWHQGFGKVEVLDISLPPLENLRGRLPDFPAERLLHRDFFAHEGQYDRILEQTFFCALDPAQRPAYAAHMARLLAPGGKLAGLLFDFPLVIRPDGQPYGGSAEEYAGYFEPYFHIRTLARCYNSHPARAGRELFIVLERI